MRKYQLTARKNRIDPKTMMIHDDDGLLHMDAIKKGSMILQVPDDTDLDIVCTMLLEDLEREYPGFQYDTCEIQIF